MLLDSGTFAGRRVLSPAAVAAMEHDWRRGAAVEPPAPVRSFGYGIGMWIDRTDSAGRAVELSSQGAYGFTPWIDRERNLLGVLAVRYDGGAEAFETSRKVREIVRELAR
jgi:CubicO group peptidase (beta-lactamase class C family)